MVDDRDRRARPGFELPDTEGRRSHWPTAERPTAVVFTCNHCPYALAWHDRLARRRARLRRARRALPGDQLERRRALPGRLATRRCSSASTPTAAGRCPTCTTRPRRSRARGAPRRRRTCSWSTPGLAALPRRARRRLRRPGAERRLAARRARRAARRRAARPGRDRAGRLLDQVEALGSARRRRLTRPVSVQPISAWRTASRKAWKVTGLTM